MSRRPGQCGQVFVRKGKFVGRYYEDTAEGRVRRGITLGICGSMTKPEAQRKLLDLITGAGINTAAHLERALGTSITFERAALDWESSRLRKLSLSSQYIHPRLIARHLNPFFGQKPIDSIRTGDVNQWISSSMRKYQPKTIQNVYRLLCAVVNWKLRQEDLPPRRWSPDLPALPTEEQRWFTPEEMSRIIETSWEPYKTLFQLAAASGCRAGEMFALHVEDVDFSRRTIRIVRSIWKGHEVPTKTRKGCREIFLDSGTMEALREFIGERTTGRVFELHGEPLDDTSVVNQALYPVCDMLKIKRGGMHAFRHGRVSMLRSNGVPDDVVKRQIGHSSLRTTSGYTHFSEEYQRGLAEKLGIGLTMLDSGDSRKIHKPKQIN